MTVEFRISSRISVDHRRRMITCRIVWIHPAYNSEFCDYYQETPGDLPNFYVEIQNSEGPPEIIDDLETVADLENWLEEFQFASVLP